MFSNRTASLLVRSTKTIQNIPRAAVWARGHGSYIKPNILRQTFATTPLHTVSVPSSHHSTVQHDKFRTGDRMSSRDVTGQTDITKQVPQKDGSFKRRESSFRNFIVKGGQFEPEADRYHLYVSLACPWASRTLIMRKLKGLEDMIPITVVSPYMGPNGWAFTKLDSFPDTDVDPNIGAQYMKDLYLSVQPDYDGRFTVPLLWDKKQQTIVNNESSEIIRIFNSAFNEILPADKAALDFYPEELQSQIDEVNEWVYPNINNGVYRAGFATRTEAYTEAVHDVFKALDRAEEMLTGKDYIVGDKLTEADIRLYVTIVRFDPVYFGHFKCNFREIRDGYPAIHLWLRKLYWQNDAFKSTTNFDHIKTHYYWSHASINPTRIVPAGPVPNIRPL